MAKPPRRSGCRPALLTRRFGQASGIHGNFHFADPTPGLANTTPHAFGWLEAPRLAKPPGRYAEAIDWHSSRPTKQHAALHPRRLRARCRGNALRRANPPGQADRGAGAGVSRWLPAGADRDQQLFCRRKNAFPIASISTDPGNLFDPDQGIYTEGRDFNGTPEPVYNFKQEI